MTKIEEYRTDLATLERSSWPDYLDSHSGLPGPRGNIELASAVADLGDPDLYDELIASGDEYRTFCGVLGLGDLAEELAVTRRLYQHASDERWRIREAVAMALQRLGDIDLPALEAIVLEWADDPDPLVQRAAAAGICEPRLLRSPKAAAVAVEVCERATRNLAARPAATRREAGVRALRQGLGYCWSVAVAADPAAGLPVFCRLSASPDPDVAWIVRSNLSKKRLARLL